MKVFFNNKISIISSSYTIKKNSFVGYIPSFGSEIPQYSQNNTKAEKIELSNLPAKGIQIQTAESVKFNERVHELYLKLQKQLNPITKEEVEKIISSIEKNGANREETLYAMNMLTQYGNITSLVELAGKLKALGINKFYLGLDTPTNLEIDSRKENTDIIKPNNVMYIASNLALDYLYKSKHIAELADDDDKGNTAVILDEAVFNFFDNNPEEISNLKKDRSVIFINLEGWNNGLNIYRQGKDNSYIIDNASKLIKNAKNIQKDNNISFEEAFNYSMNESVIKKTAELGIKPVSISVNKTTKPDINTIVQNLSPMNVSEKYIHNVLNAIGNIIFYDDENKAQRSKTLLADYFLSQMEVYSPRRIGERLKEIHDEILDYASKHYKSDGKPYTQEDIIYLIPKLGKSYDQIYLQYAQVNDIDMSKFIYTDKRDYSSFPNDKIYVVIDDIFATGSSIRHDFGYSGLWGIGNNRHIIMAPVLCCRNGYEKIKDNMKLFYREDIDILLYNEEDLNIVPLMKSDFYNNLSESDKELLLQLLRIPSENYSGYEKEAEAILFPYMGPDTNSILSSLLLDKLLPNPKALKSRYYEHNGYIKRIKALSI